MDETLYDGLGEELQLPPIQETDTWIEGRVGDSGTSHSPKTITGYKELMEKELPAIGWVVTGLLPVQGFGIITAPPEHYKTWITLAVALSIARGEYVFGIWEVPTTVPVLIVNEEMSERLMQERLRLLWDDSASSEIDDIPISFMNMQDVKIDVKEDLEFLLRTCKERSVGVIIFDSLVRIHNKDENSSTDMKQIFEYIKVFLRAGISVLVTHHSRKPSIVSGKTVEDMNSMRGSSDISAVPDCIWGIRKEGDDSTLVLTNMKQRPMEKMEPFKVFMMSQERRLGERKRVSFTYGGLWTEEDARVGKVDGAMNPALSFVLGNSGCSLFEVADSLLYMGYGKGVTKRALDELVRRGDIITKKVKNSNGKLRNGYWGTEMDDSTLFDE